MSLALVVCVKADILIVFKALCMVVFVTAANDTLFDHVLILLLRRIVLLANLVIVA